MMKNIRQIVWTFIKKHWAVLSIILVSVVAFIPVENFVSDYQYSDSAYSSIGACFQTYLNHDYYTYFTAMFVHTSWIHLITNMLMLLFAGLVVDRYFINIVFWYYYIATNVISIGISSIFYKNDVIAGASGGIFAILVFAIWIVLASAIDAGNLKSLGVWFYISIGVALLISGFQPGQNLAIGTHLVGVILGVITIIYSIIEAKYAK